jgi:hypothetical protein
LLIIEPADPKAGIQMLDDCPRPYEFNLRVAGAKEIVVKRRTNHVAAVLLPKPVNGRQPGQGITKRAGLEGDQDFLGTAVETMGEHQLRTVGRKDIDLPRREILACRAYPAVIGDVSGVHDSAGRAIDELNKIGGRLWSDNLKEGAVYKAVPTVILNRGFSLESYNLATAVERRSRTQEKSRRLAQTCTEPVG